MKKLYATLTLLTVFGFCAQAQNNIGINNPTPDASAVLDMTSTTQGVLVPRMDSAQRAGISAPATGLLVYQTNGAAPGFYYYTGTAWTGIAGSGALIPSQLEKITENGNTGYRLLGASPSVYGDIGNKAVDLSYNNGIFTSNGGATGTYAFATGFSTTASGNYATAMGNNSVASDAGATAIGQNAQATGYNATAIGSGTNASGQYALAMGGSTTASGDYATAMGNATTASGYAATALGNATTASGNASTTMGDLSVAAGYGATAMGVGTTAPSYGEAATGVYNTTYTALGVTTFNTADRAFVVGTGNIGTQNDGLIVYKDGTVELDSLNAAPTTTNNRMYARGDSLYFQSTNLMRSGGTPSQLEKLTEGSNTGYRLLGVDTANYGNIGAAAVDLSITDGYGSLTGATGLNAFAAGLNTTASGTGSTAMSGGTASGVGSTAIGGGTASGTNATAIGQGTSASGYRAASLGSFTTASGDYSASMGKGTTALSSGEVAIGNYNTTYTPGSTTTFNSADRALVVGIGLSGSPKDGMTVYKDGTLALYNNTAAPSTTTRRLYTQSDSFYFGGTNLMRANTSQLEKLTESSQTGYRLYGVDTSYYGNIGSGAVDFSASSSASTTRGARGTNAFATGQNTTASALTATAMGNTTTASGNASTAMGNSTTASATYSTAMGSSTTASGGASTAMGALTLARSYSEVAVGGFNTDYTPASTTAFNSADRAFVVGTGISTATNDGLIVYKDGTIEMDSMGTAPTTTNNRMYTQSDSLWFQSTNLMRTTPSQLEKLNEGTGTGYRLYGMAAANYGNIGSNAVDLSYSPSASSTYGATGQSSFAAGQYTTASNYYTVAMGYSTAASGQASVALGNQTRATSTYAVALGDNTLASGNTATAMGTNTTASGSYATAMGYGTVASGNYSTAIGYYPTASGIMSFAMGDGGSASGRASATMGSGITARSNGEVAVGSYNTTYSPVSTTAYNSADRSFVVGIGTGVSGATNDGLIVYKDGTIELDSLGASPTTTNNRMYAQGDSLWFQSTNLMRANTSQLEKLTESSQTGYRLYGATAANYGDIGSGAIDFSASSSASTTAGATGANAFAAGANNTASGQGATAFGSSQTASGAYAVAMGVNNTASNTAATAMGLAAVASGYASMAVGRGATAPSYGEIAVGNYNTTYTPGSAIALNTADRAFVVGTGGGPGATNDALIVYKDGTMELDSVGTAPTTTNNRMYAQGDSLYFQSTNLMRATGNYSQLEKLTESSNTGYRLYGATAANYGDIGSGAVDLSYGNVASGTRGATGTNAFAAGYATTASGSNATALGSSTIASGSASTAMGSGTTASGVSATAMGSSSTASGISSTAMGDAVTAPSYAEAALGSYNTTYTPVGANTLSTADRAFVVGIGSGSGARNDGLIVYKDGTVELDSLGASPTTTNNRMYAQSDSLWFQGSNLMRSSPSQLEKLTESSNTGYRLYGATAANYGNIGSGAVDLSNSTSVSSTKGATGANAFASGLDNTASGTYATALGNSNTASGSTSTAMGISTIASGLDATAMGSTTTASGTVSTAMGNNTTASGTNATAMGYNTTALSYGEVAVGNYNTSYTPSGTSAFNTADRAFVVGIGTSGATKDGLTVYKTGTTLVSNNGASITGTGNILGGATYNNTALQVSSSASAMTLLSPTTSNTLNVYKSAATSTGNVFASFGYTNGTTNTEMGTIKANSTTGVTFNTTSDIRLKTDNGTYRLGLKTINDINIHNYTWKTNGAKEVGVFAQELYKVYPNAVSKGDDNDSVISQRWMVDYSKLVPVLTAAVQELSTENDRLKAELAAAKDAQSRTEASINKLNARLDALENAAPVAPTALRK